MEILSKSQTLETQIDVWDVISGDDHGWEWRLGNVKGRGFCFCRRFQGFLNRFLICRGWGRIPVQIWS